MIHNISEKFHKNKIARTVKIAMSTFFVVYAASHISDPTLNSNIPQELLQHDWYHKFAFFIKYAYGLAAGLVFYFLIYHKYDKEAQ